MSGKCGGGIIFEFIQIFAHFIAELNELFFHSKFKNIEKFKVIDDDAER